MYDYMQALREKFFSDNAYTERRQEIETMRCKLSHTLDKQRRKQLLQLVDAESQLRDDMTLDSFIAGFRLACGICSELGKDNWYSYAKDMEQRLRETFDERKKNSPTRGHEILPRRRQHQRPPPGVLPGAG